MKRILDLAGMTAGGWVGWLAGDWISLFTAYILSVIGAGLGLYVTRRFVREHLP